MLTLAKGSVEDEKGWRKARVRGGLPETSGVAVVSLAAWAVEGVLSCSEEPSGKPVKGCKEGSERSNRCFRTIILAAVQSGLEW